MEVCKRSKPDRSTKGGERKIDEATGLLRIAMHGASDWALAMGKAPALTPASRFAEARASALRVQTLNFFRRGSVPTPFSASEIAPRTPPSRFPTLSPSSPAATAGARDSARHRRFTRANCPMTVGTRDPPSSTLSPALVKGHFADTVTFLVFRTRTSTDHGPARLSVRALHFVRLPRFVAGPGARTTGGAACTAFTLLCRARDRGCAALRPKRWPL